jgi:hypothetical protein
VNSFLHPVGPEPPAVYWRRRAAVVAGLIVILVVVGMIIHALVSRGDKSGTKATAPTTVATSAAPAKGPAACKAEALSVVLKKDKPQFAEGEPVTFTADVTNKGAADCTVENTAEHVVLHIESGTDRIYDAGDCAATEPKGTAPAEGTVTIKAGATAPVKISWTGDRSEQGCKKVDEKPHRAKDATYVGTVTVNGAKSDKTQFQLIP